MNSLFAKYHVDSEWPKLCRFVVKQHSSIHTSRNDKTFVYKRHDQFTEKNVGFRRRFLHSYGYQALQSFEPLAKKVTNNINCEELAAASTYVDSEQPPVSLIPGSGLQL